MSEHVGVAIVGAGLAGIAMALRLQADGRPDFVVLERAGDLGGTWRDNRYPGVACDIPAHLYAYSFAPEPGFPTRFADGNRIQQYLRDVAEPVHDRIRCDRTVRSAVWSEERARWLLEGDGVDLDADVLVLAVGRLAEPRIPELPGLPGFTGPVVHSARWDDEVLSAGSRIGVVGSGASAVQLVPHLAAAGAAVTVFQRSAPWVLPREDRSYPAERRERFARHPDELDRHVHDLAAQQEEGFAARRLGSPELRRLQRTAEAHLRRQVADPRLRQRLAPTTPIGCKRVLLSDDWYPSIASGAVRIVPALGGIEGGRAVDVDGGQHELDAIVLATGFRTDGPPLAAHVHGVRGTLADAWADGMTAYATVAVPGFPNCFVLDGPHAALGHHAATRVVETQVGYVLDALRERAGRVADVREGAARRYADELAARAAGSVWLACDSWYRHRGSGALHGLWPGTVRSFQEVNGAYDPAAYRVLDPAER